MCSYILLLRLSFPDSLSVLQVPPTQTQRLKQYWSSWNDISGINWDYTDCFDSHLFSLGVETWAAVLSSTALTQRGNNLIHHVFQWMMELIVYAGHGGELPARVPTLADCSTVNNAATHTSSCTPDRGAFASAHMNDVDQEQQTPHAAAERQRRAASQRQPLESLPQSFVRKRSAKCTKAGKPLSSRRSRRAQMFPCGWILLAEPAPLHVSGASFLFPTHIHPHLHFIWGAVMKRFSISVWCCL